MRVLPSIEVLRAAVHYDGETGELTWLRRDGVRATWNTKHAGKPALHTKAPDGYFRGYLFSKMTLAHRVAYALLTGRTDFAFIDHINGDRADNRACNLREVDRLTNARNKARPSNSTTGHIGVSLTYDGRYRAHITVGKKIRHLGRFAALEDAIRARKQAEAELGFHKNHGRSLITEAA